MLIKVSKVIRVLRFNPCNLLNNYGNLSITFGNLYTGSQAIYKLFDGRSLAFLLLARQLVEDYSFAHGFSDYFRGSC